MHFNDKLDNKGEETTALDRCGIYALRKNSDATYRVYFACGGTVAKVAQLGAQLKKDQVAFVEPDHARLSDYEKLRDRDVEDLLLTAGTEKELTVIMDAYLESHPTIEKVIDVYQRLLLRDAENGKSLSDHFEELLSKKLAQSDLQTEIKSLKEKNLLLEVAKQAITKNHQELFSVVFREVELTNEDLYALAKDAVQAKNLNALKLIFELNPVIGIVHAALADACIAGNAEACQFILECRCVLFPDFLPLALANCKTEAHMKVIDLLLSHGSPIPDDAELAHLPRLLKDAMEKARTRYEALVQKDASGKSALHRAILRRDLVEAKRLLQAGAPINIRDDLGQTPLHQAAAFGNREAMQLLLEQGASFHVCDSEGRLPLDCAISSIEAIQCLVDVGADCEEKNGNGNTCLAEALLSKSFNMATFKYLIEKCNANIDATCGVDPKNQAGCGIPLLSRAALYRDNILQYLLDRGAEVNPGKVSTLDCLAKCCPTDFEQRQKAASLLLNFGARSYAVNLLPATMHKRAEMNEQYASTLDQSGTTPLHQISKTKDAQQIRQEIFKGSAVNCRDSEGSTPLHALLKQRPQDTKAIDQLMSYGASIRAQDHQGRTALHIAVMEGLNDGIIRFLLQQKPDVIDIQDNQGRTPLHWAAISGNEEAIKILLKNHASPSIPDKQDLLPYHLLTKYYPKVAESLYQQFNPIAGIDFKIWQQLCEFYLLEKLLCHRFGLSSYYITAAGEKMKLEGLFSEISLEELSKKAEKDRTYAQFVPLLRQANAMLNASIQGKQAITREVKQAFQSKIVPVSTGWFGHATGMVLAPEKKLLLKANRGEAIQPGESGLRIFGMQKPTQAQTEVEKSVSLVYQKEGRQHFQNGVDAGLGLKEIPNSRLRHKEQKVGNCSWVSGKLLLRGADYLSLLDTKSHAEAARESHSQYKQFFKSDRLDALTEFLAKSLVLDLRLKGISSTLLAQNGIVPQQILRDLMFKCIRKNRIDYLQLILEAYPELLASTENGVSVLNCAKGKPKAIAVIQQCFKNNSRVLFHLCVDQNIADGLEYLLREFPDLVDGEQGRLALEKAFSKHHVEVFSVLERALRSLKLNQCLTTGLRVFECNDNHEAMCLNRNAVSIFFRGGKRASELIDIVNSLKKQRKWAHLDKIPHTQLESVVNAFKGPTDDELIDYLLKNPMEIRQSKHYLLKTTQGVEKHAAPPGERPKEMPEHFYHMHDAFLQIVVDHNMMLKVIERYRAIAGVTKNEQTQETLLNNLVLMLQRRVMYKAYDMRSLNQEMAIITSAIAKIPGLKERIIKKLENQKGDSFILLSGFINKA